MIQCNAESYWKYNINEINLKVETEMLFYSNFQVVIHRYGGSSLRRLVSLDTSQGVSPPP